MYIKHNHIRLYAVIFSFLFFLLLLSFRLLYIQFFRANFLNTLAEKQHNLFTELEPRRGTIFDRKLRPLGINVSCDSLYAVPVEIKDKYGAAKQLNNILNLEMSYLLNRLNRKKYFIWIERKISDDKADKIKELGIKGLGFIKESRRFYPNKEIASQILGFAGTDNDGLEGLELGYDAYLKGEPGWLRCIRDAKQRALVMSEKIMPARDGYDLVLTIDEVIQFIAEYELDNIYKKSRAKAATIIIMDPNTGEILALANRPTFNPENPAASFEERRNRAIADYFEPGSVFKIVTAAAALENGIVKESDRFFCENGEYRVANHILHDHQSHGWLTFREVMIESSNIGVTKVAQKTGPNLIYKYAKLFGFGSRSGIDLPGEISGSLKHPSQWSKTSIGAIPIGHETGVTVLQLTNMIASVANGGLLYKPYIVKAVKDSHGEIIKEFSPVMLHRVISEDTAQRLKDILAAVVSEGTGRLAALDNFSVAGKTGTAQKIEGGRYSHDKFIATFVGFAPVENPRIAVVVMVDEPRGTYFGGTVSAPVFKNVADKVLKYLEADNFPEIAYRK